MVEIRFLAQAFLRNEWEIQSLVQHTVAIIEWEPPWLAPLARRTIRKFAEPPDLLTLEQFLSVDRTLRRQLKKFPIRVPHGLVQEIMRPMEGPPRQWPLPSISTANQLAIWLRLPVHRLNWLAGFCPRAQPPGLHYHCRWIRKRTGYRLIESPKPLLKRVQRQILDDILSGIPTHFAAHGYCFDRGVLTFVEPHVSRQVCLKMDLSQFFPSIRAGRIYRLFRSSGYPNAVARILTGLCTVCTNRMVMADSSRKVVAAQDLSRLYLRPHLPQGAPTAPPTILQTIVASSIG